MSSGGLSKERLTRLHDVLAGYVERGEAPGLVALVSRRGETHVEALGVMAEGSGQPMRRDTIFRISSMTKPITATATMLLVEECRLRLDDPVDHLLPELAGRLVLKRLDGPLDDVVPASRPITVRDLLMFTMGFGQLFAPPDAYPILRAANEQQIGMGPPAPSALPAPDEWIRRLGTLPLMYQPGERWLYNTGSDVLGVLIARASGQPFETFLRERFCEPLGMRDTSFSVPPAKLDRLATSYATHPETGALAIYDDVAGSQWSRPPAFPSGAAGLVSTVDDYLAFAQMLLSQGTHANAAAPASMRLLSRPSVEVMTADHLTREQKAVSGLLPGTFDGLGWGFGMSVVTRRDNVAESVGTYGWSGGMGTLWASDPREQLICILMTQRMWSSPSPPAICLDFLTATYQAIDD